MTGAIPVRMATWRDTTVAEHYHCSWCGHAMKMDCGYARITSTDEPDRHLCHGADHDCYALAYEANAAKRRTENTRHALGV